MTNLYFDRLQRDPKFQKKEAPAPATGLGAAIENLIAEQVAEQVEAAVEKQRPYQNPLVPEHRRGFTSRPDQHEFPAGPPTTAPPKDYTMLVQRDEEGRIKYLTVGNEHRFELQRDSQGRALRVVKLD